MSNWLPESSKKSSRRRPRHPAIAAAASACVELLEGRVLLSTTLAPVADSFTRDHDYALTNFGASPLLMVKDANSGDNRITYLKFDLSTAGQINNAVLELTGKLSSQLATPIQVGVFGVSDTSWVEGNGTIVNDNGDGFDTDNSPPGEITWNNQPAISTSALASVNIDRDTYQTFDLDVTSYLQSQVSAGNTLVTLALQGLQPTDLFTQFLSREATGPGNGPELIITGNEPAPPSATISAPDVTTASSGETITVTYTSGSGIDASTIDPSDLQISGPAGTLPVTNVQTSGSGNSVTATYTVAAPGGSWNPSQNGAYTVTLAANAVQDQTGAGVPQTLGSFRVNVGDSTPPSASISAPDVSTGGANTYSFNITYTDNVAVQFSTINIDNVGVTGPAGPLDVIGVSANPGSDASTIVATYTVSTPGGSWDSGDNGQYSVTLRTNQVLDTAGNPAEGTTANFTVSIGVPDSTPPTAAVSAPNVTAPNGTSETITVVYSDNVAVSAASIDPGDITVVGPGGVTLNVSGVNISPGNDASTITASYTVIPPGGSWDAADNGTYTITVTPGLVTDTSGNGIGTATGSFNVSAALADTSPPSASISAPEITAAGGASQTVTVVYRDNIAVSASSISADDISVSGPSGPLSVTGVTFSPQSDAGTITATYTVAAPNGVWDGTDNGAYTIALNANQVRDTSGNAAPVTFGSFSVNIAISNPADTSFANGAAISTPFNSEAVATEPDGSIIVVGYEGNGNGQTQAVIQRITAGGAADSNFGVNGQIVTPAGSTDVWYAISMQGSDHFVVAGTHNGDFAIARFDLNGNLDPTFGSRGVNFTDFGASKDIAYGLAVTATQIVVVGSSNMNLAFARYSANGVLDTSFGEGGRQVFDTGAASEALGAVAVQPDGRIIAAGSSGSNLAVVRLTASGDPDTTFDTDGLVGVSGLATRTDLSGPDFSVGLALQTDGKIVVGSHTTGGHFGVARLNSDGSMDSSFGSGGIASANFGGDDDVDSIVVQDTGEVIAVGTTLQNGVSQTAVAAFTSKGQLISNFGNSGKVTFDTGVSTTSRELHIGDLVVRAFGAGTSGGKVLVGASSQGIVTTKSSLVRLIVPGSKSSTSVQTRLIGLFGIIQKKKNRLVVTDNDGTVVTFNMTGGSAQAMTDGTNMILNVTVTGPGAVLTILTKGGDGRARFSNITVTGNLKSFIAKTSDINGTLTVTGSIGNAQLGNITGNIFATGGIANLTAGDLGGTLYSGGSIGTLKLQNVTGVIAAAGAIRKVSAASMSGGKVLAGANLGSDGLLGGSGSAADSFAAAILSSVNVKGAITGAFIGAGVDPVDSLYGNANDKSAGAASLIKSVTAKSADNATKIESASIKVVKIGGKKIDPTTDPRVKILT